MTCVGVIIGSCDYKYFNIEQIDHNNLVQQTMKSLSPVHVDCILSQLDAGHSTSHIQLSTGVGHATICRLCSKHCPDLPKAVGGHPSKLSPANIRHAVHLISSQKLKIQYKLPGPFRISSMHLSPLKLCAGS